MLSSRFIAHDPGRASKVTTECSIWLRNVVKITDPSKPFIRTGTPRPPICATPGCQMDRPLSKKISLEGSVRKEPIR